MTEFFYDSWLCVIASALPGVLLGIIYDIFRILRISRSGNIKIDNKKLQKLMPPRILRFKKPSRFLRSANNVLIFTEDILFWLIAFIVDILFIYKINNGEIRVEFIIFFLLGFWAYHISAGKLIIHISKYIIFLFRCLISGIVYIIIYPLKKICGYIFKVLRLFYKNTFVRLIESMIKAENRLYSEKTKKALLKASFEGFK